VGAEIVRQVIDQGFPLLRQAPRVLGGRDLPIPFAKPLENAVVPQVSNIVQELRRMVQTRTV
jgi:pyruvate/2-oxoglutarate/acetoin dehydrogenase E1 component